MAKKKVQPKKPKQSKKTNAKETKPTKPTRLIRIKTNANYLTVEDEQKQVAANHSTRVYNWKKDPKNKDKASNNVDPSIKKQREKDSRLRNSLRMSHEVILTKKTTDFGEYFLIHSVPILDMTQLLINFKTPEFRTIYNNNKAIIKACNLHLKSESQYSTYWLLNNNKGKDVARSGTWEDQHYTSSSNDIVLKNFMIKVAKGLNKVLHENITFSIIPGFVETTIATHQDLHVDRKINNFQNKDESYILHVPLEYEGMQLRLGKVDENFQLNHGFIYVPFGSGIVLHWTQLHAGHYGKPGNFRMHAVLSEGAWNGSHLFELKAYLEKKYEGQEVDIKSIVDQFKIEKDSTSTEMKESGEKNWSLYRTTYFRNLRTYNPAPDFLSLVKDIDDDKKKAAKDSKNRK